MAEENQFERSEPASPRRLEQAREEGVVARSQELTVFVSLVVACGAFAVFGSYFTDSTLRILNRGLSLDRQQVFDASAMGRQLLELGADALLALLPLFAVLVVAALISPLLLGGWVFSSRALQPDFKRLSPISGVLRLVSPHALLELLKAVSKVTLLGAVGVGVLWQQREPLLALGSMPLEPALGLLARLCLISLGWLAGAYALIAGIDAAHQLWSHGRKLRMSREELKREAREAEGDPQIKARVRSQQREMARRRMMAEVPQADVVVTNPTHYAVALRYQESRMRAPRVVAKGAELLAERIRSLAAEHAVPLVEAAPLARALYRHAEIGDEVPQPLYAAVAELLAYVYQLRSARRAGIAEPQPPQDIAVPDGLDPLQAAA